MASEQKVYNAYLLPWKKYDNEVECIEAIPYIP